MTVSQFNQGHIIEIIGAVIDVEFSSAKVPSIYDALHVVEKDLVLEVQQQLGDGVVRTIAMGPTEGLRRGLVVENTGAPITIPVGDKTLGRIMNVLGQPIDELGPVETDEYLPIHRKAPSFMELTGNTQIL